MSLQLPWLALPLALGGCLGVAVVDLGSDQPPLDAAAAAPLADGSPTLKADASGPRVGPGLGPGEPDSDRDDSDSEDAIADPAESDDDDSPEEDDAGDEEASEDDLTEPDDAGDDSDD